MELQRAMASVPVLVVADVPACKSSGRTAAFAQRRTKQTNHKYHSAVATQLASNSRGVRVTWEERQTCSGWQQDSGGVDKREFPDSVNIRLTAAGHSL